MEDILSVAYSIFDGAKCQRDCNARIGEFVFELWRIGIKATPGKAVFRGLFLDSSKPDILITERIFDMNERLRP